ncbi:U-box domain-containing protein 9 [Hordeum vulgare]|nr:U-box domain-containing protein 9 [Hordeum vulgare]
MMPSIASSHSKALWDTLFLERNKDMTTIVVDWQAGQQMEDNDAPMEDELAPPFLPVCAALTIDESRAHYMDMFREQEEAKFRQAHADRAYNLRLLKEHQRAE